MVLRGSSFIGVERRLSIGVERRLFNGVKRRLSIGVERRLFLPEPSPCLFERFRIWPIPTVASVGRVVYTFSGRTLCQLAPQEDDYQSAILIIVFFGVPNP